MSDYLLADRDTRKRARRELRARETASQPQKNQEMTITLLGDFPLPSDEPLGCDPYNSVQGKSARES
jgi:hypothetical protein